MDKGGWVYGIGAEMRLGTPTFLVHFLAPSVLISEGSSNAPKS